MDVSTVPVVLYVPDGPATQQDWKPAKESKQNNRKIVPFFPHQKAL